METTFNRFNNIANVVQASKAYTPAMLGVKFYSHLPPYIKSLMANRYMEEGMKRARENKEPMTRAEVRTMAAKQEVWVAT